MDFIKLPSIFLCLTILIAGCKDKHEPKAYPMPSEKTAIHKNGEDEGSQLARNKWIELMHGGPQSNWRSIEAENQQDIYAQWLKTEKSTRSGGELVAEGQILGQWIERGSNNNAGNIMVTEFDANEEVIYAVGGGGPMFKGDLSGFGWTLVNDQLRFSTSLLKILPLTGGGKRIISAVNGIPHYSNDDGVTWKKATGVTSTTDGWDLYNAQYTNDGKIFFLGKKDYNGSIKVYASYDNGVTYKTLKLFTTSDTRNITLAYNGVSDQIYVLEQTSATKSNLYKFNPATKSLDIKTSNQPFSFGESGRANLQVVTYRDTIRMYAYKNDNKIYQSKDEGKTWAVLSVMPESPWDVGLYVAPSDPRKMFFGEVNAYRSINGGANWAKVSEWWEYYDDITNKLHADIMHIKEFKDKSGKPFILNANHGGIYYTDDYGFNHTNVGLYNLNVSQYYDVRTLPANPNYIFAGSQDQGQQRGIVFEDQSAELFQNISGDYGHIEFTGNGNSLWSVYPGGSIGFYSKPLSQEWPIAGYEIKSSNETVWIPPIIPGPDPSKDIILAAGGSTTATSGGSYILQLEYKNDDIVATQLPYNFAPSGGQISAMAIDAQNKQYWYVATTNGKFYRSEDGGQSFVKTAEMLSESHYLYGSCILPSAVHPDVVYLSGNGYSNKPVYKSSDGGLTFSDFSVGLPRTMVFNIVANEDESLIFAATEAGPYVYISARNKWFALSGTRTPNQTYWSVEYVPQTKTARFATYGRGVWDFQVKDIISTVEEVETAFQVVSIFPNPATDYISISTDQRNLFKNVYIYNMNGMMVFNQTTGPGASVYVGSLPDGVYTVITDIKGTKPQKLVIRK